jgi:hypothetical protein
MTRLSPVTISHDSAGWLFRIAHSGAGRADEKGASVIFEVDDPRSQCQRGKKRRCALTLIATTHI